MSAPREAEWRERFRASMPADPEGACPPPETLWSAARGEVSGRELESLAGHLRTCATCGEALALSAELASETEPRAPARTVRNLPRFRAAAVGITALAAGLLLFLVQREPAPGRDRDLSPARGQAAGGPSIRSLSAQDQPASDARLRWTPIDGAVRYRVQVSTEDLRPVHDRTLEETTLALPPSVGEPGNGRPLLLWQVEAVLPDGRTVLSPTFRVRLVPGSSGAPR